MIAALLAAALQAATASVPPPPPLAATSAAPVVARSESGSDLPTAEGLDSLRRAYHDGCELRIYGEYDDMCSALSDQIRHYRAALAKAGRTPRSR